MLNNNNNSYEVENSDNQYIRSITKINKLVNDMIQYIPHPCAVLSSEYNIIASNSLLYEFFNISDNAQNLKSVFEEFLGDKQFDVFVDWFSIFFSDSAPIRTVLLNGIIGDLARKVQLSGTMVPIDENNCLLLTITDLTNSLDETSKLIADKNESLKEALIFERRKSDFFLNISHDLRTPLNVILSTIQLTEMTLGNATECSIDIMKRRLSIIKQNCYRLLKLVNNLIDINRIDVGYKSVEFCNFDIVSKIQDIISSITEYAENRTLCLSFKSDADELIIACDSDKLERIMFNLLSNAIKFSKQGGTIEVTITSDKNWINISVKDNGIGIPKEKTKYIFKRFKQVNDDLSSRSGGSGIGLSLVKSLVELLKGSVTLDSVPDVGSTFTVKLPNKKLSTRSSRKNSRIAEANIRSNLERIKIEFSDL